MTIKYYPVLGIIILFICNNIAIASGVVVLSKKNKKKLPKIIDIQANTSNNGQQLTIETREGNFATIGGFGSSLNTTTINDKEIATYEKSREIKTDIFPEKLIDSQIIISNPNASNIKSGIAGQVDLKFIKPLVYGKPLKELYASGRYAQDTKDNYDAKDTGGELGFTTIDQFMQDTLGLALSFDIKNKPRAKQWQKTWDYSKYWDTKQDGFRYVPSGIEGYKRGGEEQSQNLLATAQWTPNDNFELNYNIFNHEAKITETQRGFEIADLAKWPNIASGTWSGNDFLSGTISGNAIKAGSVNGKYTEDNKLFSTELSAKMILNKWILSGGIDYSKATSNNTYKAVKVISDGTSSATLDSHNSSVSTDKDLTDISAIKSSTLAINESNLEDKIQSTHFDISYRPNQSLITNITFGVHSGKRDKFYNKISQKITNNGNLDASLVKGHSSIDGSNIEYLILDLDKLIDSFAATGLTAEELAKNLASGWDVTEDTSDQYLKFDFAINSKYSLNGNFGFHYIKVENQSDGAVLNHNVSSTKTIIRSISHSYNELLPSLQLSFKPKQNHSVQLSLAKTLSKPRIDDLGSSMEVWNKDDNQAIDAGGNFTGNPELKPWLANQINLNYAWKFAGWDTLLSADLFYKGIDTSIIYNEETMTVPNDNSYMPKVIHPINQHGGYIRGFKLTYKQPFTFLPKPFDRIGIHIDSIATESNIKQGIVHKITGAEYNILGLANNITNISLWYYYQGLDIKLIHEQKSDYLDKVGSGSEFGLVKSAAYLKLNVMYKIKSSLSAKFEIWNLTNELYEYTQQGGGGMSQREGRTIIIGLDLIF